MLGWCDRLWQVAKGLQWLKKIIIFDHDISYYYVKVWTLICTWLYLLDTNSSLENNSQNINYNDGCMLLNIIYSLW
jgi:hypothetical protein